MTSQEVTIQHALDQLGIVDNAQSYQNVGLLPSELSKHSIAKEYIILGMTAKEFCNLHTSAQLEVPLDFNKLKADFKEICKDYLDPIGQDTVSKAIEFCSKIIYEIGPQSRQLRKKVVDKTWKIIFKYKEGDKVAFISTYMAGSNYNYNYRPNSNSINLSVKSASLLGLEVLEQLNVQACKLTPTVILLTPLARTIFSTDAIENIAQELGSTPLEIAHEINASCGVGGEYLSSSRMHVAVVAVIVATRNVKDAGIRNGTIGKICKQYLLAGKKWDATRFELYYKYAHGGGVPSDILPDKLISLYEAMPRVTPLQAIRSAKETAFSYSVTAPTTILQTLSTPRKLRPKEEEPGMSGSNNK